MANFDNVVWATTTLLLSPCELCKLIGCARVECLLPFIGLDAFMKSHANEPLALVMAMAVSSFSPVTIQLLVANARGLPESTTSRLEHLIIDVDEAGASAGLMAIFKSLRMCRGKVLLPPLVPLLIPKLYPQLRVPHLLCLLLEFVIKKRGPTSVGQRGHC
jgi:hypothetical protein